MIKVLSVKQPWAWAIVSGIKPVENRTRKSNYRGRLYIQASLKDDEKGFDEFLKSQNFHSIKRVKMNDEPLISRRKTDPISLSYAYEEIDMKDKRSKTKGAIVGYVDMVDCITSHSSYWFTGPYGYALENHVILTKPIPLKGQLGIFNADVTIPYRPSNGTEGSYFDCYFCENCWKDHDYRVWLESEGVDQHCDGCKIYSNSMCLDIGDEGYPKEWVSDPDGTNPRCTAFQDIHKSVYEDPDKEQMHFKSIGKTRIKVKDGI